MDSLGQLATQLTNNNVLGRIVIALVLVAIIALVSHAVVRWIKHIMSSDNNNLAQSSIYINIARGIIWGLGTCLIADSCFNVNMTALVAALGVGGIAISLGFQDTLTNLIGGTQITFMRIVSPGDNIQVGSNTGVVQDINWRHTTIKNKAGETVIIPNSVISKNAVVHLPGPEQISIPFVVTSQDTLEQVEKTVAETARTTALQYTTLAKRPAVHFTEVADTGIKGKVVLSLSDAAQSNTVSDAITRSIAPLVR